MINIIYDHLSITTLCPVDEGPAIGFRIRAFQPHDGPFVVVASNLEAPPEQDSGMEIDPDGDDIPTAVIYAKQKLEDWFAGSRHGWGTHHPIRRFIEAPRFNPRLVENGFFEIDWECNRFLKWVSCATLAEALMITEALLTERPCECVPGLPSSQKTTGQAPGLTFIDSKFLIKPRPDC